MRVEPNTPISKALGFNPRGVTVDNVTPYWLFFPQSEQYCPPFTVGWTTVFTSNTAGYAYMEVKTPFGESIQLDVPGGLTQYVNLVWTDGEIVGSNGASVDPKNLITTSISGTQTFITSPGKVVRVSANGPLLYQLSPPNSRTRIRMHFIQIALDILNDEYHNLSPVEVNVFMYDPVSGSTPQIAQAVLSWPHQQKDQVLYPGGLDLPMGWSLQVNAFTQWADQIIKISGHYQVIQ